MKVVFQTMSLMLCMYKILIKRKLPYYYGSYFFIEILYIIYNIQMRHFFYIVYYKILLCLSI